MHDLLILVVRMEEKVEKHLATLCHIPENSMLPNN